MVFKQEDFTEQAQEAIGTSQEIVRRYRHAEWDTEHVLLALLENDKGVRPLSTFVDVEFEVRRRREGDFIFEGTTPEGLRVEKTFSLSPESHMHNVSMKIVNTGPQGVVARYALGWGPGIESGDPDKKFGIKSQRALGFESSRLRKLKPMRQERQI